MGTHKRIRVVQSNRLMLPAILAGAMALDPSSAVGGSAHAGSRSDAPHPSPVVSRADVHAIRVPSGSAVEHFDFFEPGGAIRLLRLTVPLGAHARLTGVIPGTAGVRLTVPRARNDPSEACHPSGATEVCTQWEEACPMPAAKWHFTLHKLGGTAGEVRVVFVVGR